MEKRTYKVTSYDRRDRKVGASVYIRSTDRTSAAINGPKLLRYLGQRGRFTARAIEYNPLSDPEMHRFIREV